MTALLRQDHEARRRIRENLGVNLMCEASAGTGKTRALVERMVETVATGAAEIDQMAAITFTRKAAGEMRSRFVGALRDKAEEEARLNSGRARRLRRAVQRVDQCAIGTIHAFCARLLRERPFEAGLPPDFREVEERDEVWLVREAWDRFLQERSAAGDERLLAMEETGLTAEQFYDFYRQRCQFSDLALKPTEGPRPDLEPAVARACELVREIDAGIPDRLPEGRPDSLMETARSLRYFVDFAGPPSDADRERLLRSLASTSQTSVTLKCWGPRGSPEQALARRLRDEELPAFREGVLKPLLREWRQYVYRLTGDLVDEAMGFYRRSRLEAATLTFNDLLELTESLLRDSPGARAVLQRRCRRLFVDEFQDTDPLQAAILLYLTADDHGERDWRRLIPAPGRLFLVGDEKQAIYRFRRADLDVYRLVRDQVSNSGGEVVELTTSFRSRPGLVGWLNDAFEPQFESHDARYQAAYRRLTPELPEKSGAGVYRLRGRAGEGSRQEQASEEADRIAAFISAALRGGISLNGADRVLGEAASPGDFMVLTRTRRYLSEYSRALEERGIPYDVTGAGSLRSSGELRALVDALEAVLRPDDPVALIACLRGPLYGLGDDDLYRLRKAGWRFRFTEEAPEGLVAPLDERLDGALQGLRQLRRDLDRRPAAAALERFVEGSGLAAVAAGRPAGSSRVGNLLRVLSMVREWQGRNGLDWARIASYLRDLLEEDELRVEEMTLETGRPDVVRVMNLHQAKGLEAKVVFLADPADQSAARQTVDTHVSRLGESPYLSMAVTMSGRFRPVVLAEPDGWEQDQAEEERFAAAEELRLVYVAATRARDVLVVSLSAHRRGGPWSPLDHKLSGAPELPVPAADTPARGPQDSPPAADFAELRRERVRSLQAAAVPSYSQTAVTEEEELAAREADPETRGRGRSYGTAVHRLLESLVTRRLEGLDKAGLRAFVRSILVEEGLDDEVLEQAAMTAIHRFRESELWSELRTAGDEVHAEVPFGEARDEGVRRGVIDLVYRVGEGAWKVVDYKTHRGEEDLAMESLAARYADQVAAYAEHWERASGERVTERGLWLASSDGADRYISL